MSPRYAVKFLMLLAFLLIASPATAQEEKFFAIGCSSAIVWRPPFGAAAIIMGSLEYKFSAHWSIQPEVVFSPKAPGFFLPCVYVVYTFNNFQKYGLFLFLSLGLGGWAEPKAEFGMVLINIRTGIRRYMIKDSRYGVAFKFGVSGGNIGFGPYIGLELCLF